MEKQVERLLKNYMKKQRKQNQNDIIVIINCSYLLFDTHIHMHVKLMSTLGVKGITIIRILMTRIKKIEAYIEKWIIGSIMYI